MKRIAPKVLLAMAVVVMVLAISCKTASVDSLDKVAIDGQSILTYWDDDAAAKNALIDYVEAVVDENSADYIPV